MDTADRTFRRTEGGASRSAGELTPSPAESGGWREEELGESLKRRLHFSVMAAAYKYRLMSPEEEGGGADGAYTALESRQGYNRWKVCALAQMAILLLLISVLIWTVVGRTSDPEVCLTPECVDVSAYIARKMNLTADPCQDFYSYACGGWEANTFIPPAKAKYDTFSEVRTKNQAILKRLLDDPSTMYKGRNSSAAAKVKMHYRACMNVTKIEADGAQPMLKWIKKMGSWSISPDWDSNQTEKWNLTSALLRFQALGQVPLFSFGLSVDAKNSSRHILSFSQSGLTLGSRDEYLDDAGKFRHAFLSFAVQVGQLLGGDESTQAKMEAVYAFEKSMAEIFVPKEELIDPVKTYNVMSVAQLQKEIGNQIEVRRMMTSLIARDLGEEQTVVVSTIGYFQKLGPLLANTSRQVLQDYMVWHMIQLVPGYLPARFVDAVMELNKVELGVTSVSPRWQRCVAKAGKAFGWVTAALYVEKTFPPESKSEALKILTGVQAAFIDNLDSLRWMDQTTKDKAREKAVAMGKVLGYPDWILDPDKLDQYYQDAAVMEGKLLDNYYAVSKFEVAQMWKKWGKEPDRNDWNMMPDQVNAFFSGNHNHIAIMAGLLQRPYFDLHYPMSFAYGAMGMISGHELTHGFDNHGRKSDKDGNMRDWWTNSSATAFAEHSRCMVDQYHDFTYDGTHLNGEYTLAENIADNGGLKFGHAAYMKVKGQDKEYTLPGLDLSPKQLFFLGFAQIWCAHYTPEYARTAILSDEHTMSKYRVLGSVANAAEFAEAFNCPVDSPLNPGHKCSIW